MASGRSSRPGRASRTGWQASDRSGARGRRGAAGTCVLEPQVDQYGDVFLRHVTLTAKADWQMSVSEERDLLVQQGLSRRAEVLDRYWSCPEPRCPRHDPMVSSFVLLPVAHGDRLVCDQHGLDMVDIGPRPRVAQLKIMRDGRERHRFTVTQREPVVVGRAPGPGDLSPFLDETILRGVSRAHLRFDLDSDRLTVTDLSRNGTVLILRNGTQLDLRQAAHSFIVGDRAQIHPSVEIIRSGRRYPTELSDRRRITQPQPSDPPAPTVSFWTIEGRAIPTASFCGSAATASSALAVQAIVLPPDGCGTLPGQRLPVRASLVSRWAPLSCRAALPGVPSRLPWTARSSARFRRTCSSPPRPCPA